jgi:hypothetical protein
VTGIAGGTAAGAQYTDGTSGFSRGNAAQQLGVSFVSGMNDILQKSSHEDVKSIYQKYGNQLTVQDPAYPGGAFYRYGEGVYLNAGQVAKGDMIHKPYQTAFHEFGHNIDYIMGNGRPISESWGNNALYDAIKQDFETLKGSQTNEQLVAGLKEQMKNNGWTIMDTASVSDIIESMTGISYPLGVGHGKDYWDNRLPNKEFFAETLDGAAANERSYGLMQKIFPHAVKVVHQIIGGNI